MKKLEDLKMCEAVHDMRDGVPNFETSFDKPAKLVAHVRMEMNNSLHIVQEMMEQAFCAQPGNEWKADLAPRYVNKMLVLVAVGWRGPRTKYQFAYSIDDRILGLIEIED